jgi:putative membrane-bound dehydrogenase-like protein
MPRLLALLALSAGFSAPLALADDLPETPKVAEGWKIELVVQAPQIMYPTAIVVAPDGTIYLGQDPMDMPGPPTQPIDSIVTLKEGKVSVFAEKLWSVMGLEWVDGALYVVHAPYLSVFRDKDGDGRAEERTDLITGLGPRLPGFNGINDHIASGLRLGMDGYLYIAVGDKGIPKGVARDGTTIQMFSGGVIRIRPDGTGLEIVSTGERNPLSVALTSTDEIFTYGNDDDSHQWPNSLTHHIVSGHYGYPYQFLTAPERCLPIVAGKIGGAGAQGICYNEDGLPEKYRGNLIFCDWGTQMVTRYIVERAGGTFRLKAKEVLVEKGELDDFRPFAIAVAADGASFYLVDWAFNGWLAAGPKTGRLYRLRYEGPDKVTPAARPSGQDLTSLIAALDHPAHSLRLASQRALAKLGPRAVPGLVERLKQAEPITGRLHALWALDAINTPEARAAIRAALINPDPELRLQAIRSAGVRRDRATLPQLRAALADSDARLRREAAIALAKTGRASDGPSLYAALGDPDSFASWAIRWAIRQLQGWDESALVAALLDPKRRDDALKLTDEAWDARVVNALTLALSKTQESGARARIVANLAGLYRQYPPWSGHWFGTNPLAGSFPEKTKDWDRNAMAKIIETLGRGLDDPAVEVRRKAIAGLLAAGPPAASLLRARLMAETDPINLGAMAQGLGRLVDTASLPLLTALVRDRKRPVEVRAAVLDALAAFRDRPAIVARLGVVYDPQAPAPLVALALVALGRAGLLPPNDLIGFLDRPEPVVRAAALWSLAARPDLPPNVCQALLAKLDDPSPEVAKAALGAIANLRLRAAIPKLLELSQRKTYRTEVLVALAAMPDPRALTLYVNALSDPSPELRRMGESALLAIRDLVAGELESQARAGRFEGPAALAVERILTRFRPITDWRVIGPFPRTIAQVFLGEPAIDFAQSHIGAGGLPIAWKARQADPATGKVVLDDLKAGAGDRGGFGYDINGSPDLAAFAFAEIESDSDRPALLLVGSSGTILVAVNEQLVHHVEQPEGRPYAPDSDLMRISLKKGQNRLLLLSRQGIGAWSFSVQISDPSESLFTTQPGPTSLAELRDYALNHDGDPAKGTAIFFDPKGIGCAKCHSAGGRGGAKVGPDLSGLALKYDKAEIIRSVLEPSSRIATGYQPVLVATTDGQVIAGLPRAENAVELELVAADGRVLRIAKAGIVERRVSHVSLMPVGLVDTLRPEQFADLIAFLRSLRSGPSPGKGSAEATAVGPRPKAVR